MMKHLLSGFGRMGYGRRVVVTLAIGMVGFAGLTAVGAQAQNQDVPGTNEQTPPPQPTFRGGVTLVTTDVIVRDQNGSFIPNLSVDDFTILEDEVLQDIASLVLVHGGRVYNELSTQPPVQEGIILPSARQVDDTAGRIIIIFIDDLHLAASLTPMVRRVFRQIAENLVHEGDLFAIISTGGSSIRVNLTYDQSYLADAEERIMGSGITPDEMLTMRSGVRGIPELSFRVHQALKTARNMIESLDGIRDRRKVFVYLSSGYELNPFGTARRYSDVPADSPFYQGGQIYQGATQAMPDIPYAGADPFQHELIPGTQWADADLMSYIVELSRAANRANTSFYTVDPRGLVGITGVDQRITIGTREFADYVFKTQSTLRTLAHLTGGKAIVNRNDFEDALREVDAETSDYYILGYYTNNPDPTRHTRRLKVEVNREDVNLRHRETYTFSREALGMPQ